ncbi:hypothetical protein Ga0102493_112774 [Erythrobacter litoralis]|uniref:General stress protein 17M-like domain-containing protein n=1 Tax=Erythrobacter litoralis TaxID=39960 RepID=A0A074MUP6_9SPHN|nr:hypothetical protein [Erythrobacter litoralis]AOL23779.1 hypothetical protein Ga0102493_112774 [Erythrobacter litoralis]KEO98736.1 hypothetical protein EH32_06420 [Erythrobacter litoralis]
MTSASNSTLIREAVAYFDSGEDLEAAIDELLRSGFNRAEISLLASDKAVTDHLGHKYHKVSELEDDPAVPRTFYVPTESIGGAEGALIATPLYLAALSAIGGIVASGGSLLAIIVGAVAASGAGGALGTALAKLVGEHHAKHLQDQLDHGGLLLWVRTWDSSDEERAAAILSKHSGHDVHLHGSKD